MYKKCYGVTSPPGPYKGTACFAAAKYEHNGRWYCGNHYAVAVKDSLELKLFLPIPEGKCQCGCGGDTIRNYRTDTAKGWNRGEYRAFITGHNASFKPRKRIVEKIERLQDEVIRLRQQIINLEKDNADNAPEKG